jgi:arginase
LETQVIQVPYDSGRKDLRMGSGPGHLVKGLERLKVAGVHIDRIETDDPFPLEAGTTFKVLKLLSGRVRNTMRHAQFPLVLAGGCISCVGTLAGLDSGSTAIVWLDAHGDFNTPETTVSGFLDGMALATATGRCWQNLAANVPGFRPVSEKNVVLIGARDFDPAERRLLDDSAVTLIESQSVRKHGVSSVLGQALAGLRAQRVYLHIDLDVLDPDEARANQFSVPGGLSLAEVLEVAGFIGERLTIAAAAITAYDPAYDKDGKALRAATALMKQLCTLSQPAVRTG